MIELEMRGLGLFGAVLLSTGTLAQVQQPRSACMENAIVVPCTASSHAERTTSAGRNRRCTICRDDLRVISFPPSSEPNQKVTVQPDGIVGPPNPGSFYGQGSTLPGLAYAVKEAYSKAFQKAVFAVPERVEEPGQYDLRYDLKLTQAIAAAGGLAATAKSQVFLYRPVSPNWAQVQKLKIKHLFRGRNISEAQTPCGERPLRWWQRA